MNHLAPALLLLVATSTATSAASIPGRPDELKFPPLRYDAPNRDAFRHVLSNGVVAYVVEDPSLPLVDVGVIARGGDYLDPLDKLGLAAITTDQMRSGGAGDKDAEAFDAAVDFLAVDMNIGSGPKECTASLNCLSKDLDKALDLLFAALREPRFQQDRIDLYKTTVKQTLEHRNDSTTGIEMREWRRLLYGTDTFESRQQSTTTLDAITRDDLVAFHRRVFNPSNLLIRVSGAVKQADVLAALERHLAGWAPGEKSPDPPVPTHVAEPGVFVVNKDDVNQTRVSIGQRSTTWDDPRRFSLEVMNEILGGGGFTSRIIKSVRSDAGLAYSAGSVLGFGRTYPMTFRVLFQSKNASVAQALDLSLAEIDRMRKEPVTAEELDIAKNGFIETFPQRFATAEDKASVFIDDELAGRPADYWEKYRPGISSVTAASVQSAAAEFLKPDALTVLVVGKVSEVLAGDPDKPDHQIETTAARTGIKQIPLPDAATLAYPNEPAVIVPPMPAPSATLPHD
jgi:zinc protease